MSLALIQMNMVNLFRVLGYRMLALVLLLFHRAVDQRNRLIFRLRVVVSV